MNAPIPSPSEATETPPLLAALHAQVQAVAARPLDVRMLVELEKTCMLARELLVVGQQPTALNKRRLISSGFGEYGDGVEYATPVNMGMSAQPAYSSPQETFGVTAIRELVGSLASFMPKPPENSTSVSDLTHAISLAKSSGDAELEQQLRAALRHKMAEIAPIATPTIVEEPAP